MREDNKGEHFFTHTKPYAGVARVYEIVLQIDRPTERSGRQYHSIWDTGATHTTISQRLAQLLDLAPVGFTDTHTANGTAVRCPIHLVDVRFESGLLFKKVPVIVANLLVTDVLIGTDIISQGDFSVTNCNEKTIVTFGVPSIKKHDYVAEAKLKKHELV